VSDQDRSDRRLDRARLLPLLRAGVKFADGVRIQRNPLLRNQLTVNQGKPPDHDRPIHNI
jgi:hypothetical protein